MNIVASSPLLLPVDAKLSEVEQLHIKGKLSLKTIYDRCSSFKSIALFKTLFAR